MTTRIVVLSDNDDFIAQIDSDSGDRNYIQSYWELIKQRRNETHQIIFILIIDATSDDFTIQSLDDLIFKPDYSILVTPHDKQELVTQLIDDVSDVWYLPLHPKLVERGINNAKTILDHQTEILEYLGYLSHELSNPIASVKGYADLMLSGLTGELTEQHRKFLSAIFNSGQRVNDLIDDLRDEVNIRFNKFQVFPDITQPNDMLVNFRDNTYPQLIKHEDNPAELSIKLSENAKPIMADEARIIQLISRVINAGINSSIINIYFVQNKIQTHFQITGLILTTHTDKNGKIIWSTYFYPFITAVITKHGGKFWIEEHTDNMTVHFTIPNASDKDAR
ncbi:MAG: histidine kinase dimerization/phospho-acceptor domain-containing protein [Phototrophicaceae bacterium]